MTEQQLAQIIVDAIKTATTPLWTRIRQLEARVAPLDGQSVDKGDGSALRSAIGKGLADLKARAAGDTQ